MILTTGYLRSEEEYDRNYNAYWEAQRAKQPPVCPLAQPSRAVNGAEQIMGTFDPGTFLDVNMQEPNDTVSTPVPEGEYMATSGEPKLRDGIGKDNKPWVALDVPWTIDAGSYPQVKEKTGRDINVVTQSIFIELNASGNGIDIGHGKNINLGRLREALGVNKPGQAFSLRQLGGRVAKVQIKHRPYQDQIFADVKGVAPA